MDAAQQFLAKQGVIVPKTFIIAGASKRGWASQLLLISSRFLFSSIRFEYLAWLTAAVDNNERIIGAIPIVMDILNFPTV